MGRMDKRSGPVDIPKILVREDKEIPRALKSVNIV